MKTMMSQKRRQVILVAVGTLAALAGLWFGLISAQYRNLHALAASIIETQDKLDAISKTLKSAPQLDEQLANASEKLGDIEENMASGDYYSWVFNKIRQFKLGYRVDIPQYSTIVGPTDTKLLPHFPYKQVTLTIGGTGFYHDIGRFVADFENQFPYSQVQNLEFEPTAVAGGEAEKLSFRMDIVTLVRPGA